MSAQTIDKIKKLMTAPGILLLAFVSPNSKGQLIFPALICWVVIYEMDGAIQPLIIHYSQKKFSLKCILKGFAFLHKMQT